MKTLLVLRHAKSSWKENGLDDHDRPLNKRGKRDAPRMGRLLLHQRLLPDLAIGSTAVRAATTLTAALNAAGADCEVRLTPGMYLASASDMAELLHEVPDMYSRVMLVGHNPGMEELVEALTGAEVVMPTAALACIDCRISRWSELALSGSGALLHLWKPKELPAG